jgi:UvrD-like helicase C-terminal domain/Nuclease-related domain/AAA domain
MAVMIPEKLPSNATQGERRTFALLQKLPDDCICYYEPVIGERYPDFVVIIPTLGVLIIEVKGWYRSQLERADTRDVAIRQDGVVQVHKHPVRQAREYKFELMNACQRSRHASHLLYAGGQREGNFVFPFGHMALMSNMTRDQVRQGDFDIAQGVFGDAKMVMRDEMDALLDLTAEQLIDVMRGWFDPTWSFPRLTRSQIDAIRLIIHPEIVIEGTSLAVLDHKQEAKARSIGQGHRLVYGVAGSGKTVILMSRARMLAKDSGRQILVLCYNKELARKFKDELMEFPNIRAMNFHRWVARNRVRVKHRDFTPEAEDLRVRLLLDRLQAGKGEAGLYDAVLIDEAQDFDPRWFTCAKLALKNPEDGDLLIALDGGQNLYGRKTFTWKSVGVNAVGRVMSRSAYDFDRNYRNTRQILTVAAPFAAVNVADDEDDALQSHRVDPGCAVREGPLPKTFAAKSRELEIDAIVRRVADWLNRGFLAENGEHERLSPDDIAILYPRCPDALKPLFEDFMQRLAALVPVKLIAAGASAEARRGTAVSGPAVTVGTIHSVKGLQFRAVILMWADVLYGPNNAERHRNDRALLYVGLTRAQTFLRVCWTRGTTLTAEIEAAIASIDDGEPPLHNLDGRRPELGESAAEPFRWWREDQA